MVEKLYVKLICLEFRPTHTFEVEFVLQHTYLRALNAGIRGIKMTDSGTQKENASVHKPGSP